MARARYPLWFNVLRALIFLGLVLIGFNLGPVSEFFTREHLKRHPLEGSAGGDVPKPSPPKVDHVKELERKLHEQKMSDPNYNPYWDDSKGRRVGN